MPFSHHSHSGQFCSHARNTLAQVLTHAIDVRKMRTFALTEHMPRGDGSDLYPEEVEAGLSVAGLWAQFEAFHDEATALRRRVDAQAQQAHERATCDVLVGFEVEWIRSPQSAELVREVLQRPGWRFDFFVGSVHHVRGVPIDFDAEMYARAVAECGGDEEHLFAEYCDAQHEMLVALEPKVVGHFDLIRLLSREPDRELRDWDGGRVWGKVLRNLAVVKGYGGLLELNSSALRKGLREPYPRREICEAWMDMGGGFVMSDDSHGVEQVGTCYPRLLKWIGEVGLQSVSYLAREEGDVVVKTISVADLKNEEFWST